MASLPSDPTQDPFDTPPESVFSTIFANLNGSKRFTLAQSLNSQGLLQACIQCEPFLNFFFRFEEIILREILKSTWGHDPTDARWQKCVLLQQDEEFVNLQETTVKAAITDYLRRFKYSLPSKSQVDDAVSKRGKDHPKATDLELEDSDEPSWKLVFWFFPNLAILVPYEGMIQENHLARLWIFSPQHLEPSAIASFSAARRLNLPDATYFPKLSTIDNVSGQALRGLVKFCLQRNLFVRREENHHSERPLPNYLWCTQDRIDLINMETCYWLYENYTAEVTEEMHQIYKSLENFLTHLWKRARDYAIQDATRDARRMKLFINQYEHPDPDNIGPDSELVEDVVCKQAVERLLVTLGSPRPRTSRGSVLLPHTQSIDNMFNMSNSFATVNLDEFIWHFMGSNPVNYTVRPTARFRGFVKKWRSETILRQTLGPENYAWINQRDADFFEKAVRQVKDMHQDKEARVRQAIIQIAAKKLVHQPKRSMIRTIINRVKDSMRPSSSLCRCVKVGKIY